MAAEHDTAVAEQTLRFRKSVPDQVRLQELARLLGPTDRLNGLEVGSNNGAFSLNLRKLGGVWQSVAWDPAVAGAVGAVLGETVPHVTDGSLPFRKKLFDVVVVMDVLERFPDDIGFIEECHKVLKSDGRLIVAVQRVGPWQPIRALRNMLGLTPAKQGFVRAGYTESELFRILKSGFDVHVVRAYSRFFVELTEAIVTRLVERCRTRDGGAARLARLYGVAGFIYHIAFHLDSLLIFSRGYRFVAAAKRRAWRPRDAPVLVDGRSISEAVLSRAPV